MAGSVPTLYWFDRWDERIGLLRVVGELVHTEELNGEDTLEFCSYEVPTKGDRLLWLDGDDADLGDTVAVIDTSRDPEWRLTARVVRRVRTFGEQVVARVTIGTVEPVDYAQVSALAADVATLRDDVVGIDGNLTTAASVTVVENTVTTAIDDLDELGDLDF